MMKRNLFVLSALGYVGTEKVVYSVGFLGFGLKKTEIALIHSSLPYQLAQSTKHRWLMRWVFRNFTT